MTQLIIGQHVTIKGRDKTDPNHEGRVDKQEGDKVYISNLNQPYCGTMTMEPFNIEDVDTDEQVTEQLEFITWLKWKKLYNPMDSAHTMQRMHDVWKAWKEGEFMDAYTCTCKKCFPGGDSVEDCMFETPSIDELLNS